MSVSYSLISTVQDLHDLYTRHGPSGPYRNTLFHDPLEPDQDWPEAVARRAGGIDVLIRGISCLLANNLETATFPLCGELLMHVIGLERECLATGPGIPEYYRYLQAEIGRRDTLNATDAYRLFGEVLAVYLDVLALAHPPVGREFGARISKLRREVVLNGEAQQP